ncbi:hypothetical protein CDAR_99381 [Caerostris darwini]|uniref:Uncharacterized protein n=1 Tax=Caerostris darwini TaxID=1538125 RepID=A0AAV4UP26_9ARAC|nr:hypothetical protein CDAR_99381 [Caerostris darwini]
MWTSGCVSKLRNLPTTTEQKVSPSVGTIHLLVSSIWFENPRTIWQTSDCLSKMLNLPTTRKSEQKVSLGGLQYTYWHLVESPAIEMADGVSNQWFIQNSEGNIKLKASMSIAK